MDTYQKCRLIICGLVLLTSSFVSAQQIERLYSFANFSKINASGHIKIYLKQSDHFEIKIKCDKPIDEHLQINQDGLVLNISTTPVRDVEAYISMPQLESVILSRFSELSLPPLVLQKPLYIELNDFSKLFADTLKGPQISVLLTRRSSFTAAIQFDEINIHAQAVSNIDINALASRFTLLASNVSRSVIQLNCKNSIIESSGSSYVDLNMIASDVIVKTSGASKVKGKGQWEQQNLTASGVSQIDFRDAYAVTSSMESGGSAKILVSGTKTQYVKTSGASKIVIEQNASEKNLQAQAQMLQIELDIIGKRIAYLREQYRMPSSDRIQATATIGIMEQTEDDTLEQVRLFENLVKQLERSNKDATIKIGNKTVLIRDSKISTIVNADGSVSIFVNGVEEEKYK